MSRLQNPKTIDFETNIKFDWMHVEMQTSISPIQNQPRKHLPSDANMQLGYTRIGYGECMVHGTGLGGVGSVDFCCSFGFGILIGFAFSLIAALSFSNHFFGFRTSFGFGTFSFDFWSFCGLKKAESRLRLANLRRNQILGFRGSDSAYSWHLLVDVSNTFSIMLLLVCFLARYSCH